MSEQKSCCGAEQIPLWFLRLSVQQNKWRDTRYIQIRVAHRGGLHEALCREVVHGRLVPGHAEQGQHVCPHICGRPSCNLGVLACECKPAWVRHASCSTRITHSVSHRSLPRVATDTCSELH